MDLGFWVTSNSYPNNIEDISMRLKLLPPITIMEVVANGGSHHPDGGLGLLTTSTLF